MSLIRSTILRSLIVGATACLSVGVASAATIYSDDFGTTATNNPPGWTQLEQSSSAVSIIVYPSPHYGVLALSGYLNGNPDAGAAAGIFSTPGYTNIAVSFDWLNLHTESGDKLYFSYIINPVGPLNTALMQNEGAWTQSPLGGLDGGGTEQWHTFSAALTAGPINSIAIMFWVDLTDSPRCSYPSNDCNSTDYFKIDNFVLSGDPATVTPIPAALPLFASGLGALGVLGWRRKRKAAA
jgi:hypothetical protein